MAATMLRFASPLGGKLFCGPKSALCNTSRVFAFYRFNSTASHQVKPLTKLRNIGISAHIDSGKTTLTERILFYTGRIGDIHEVKGKDGQGAKMDFMDLEREKGITIQSAATHCLWGDNRINIIDTPGHVDFTIEVERALRVLDGAVLVVCGVGGVQSQTYTVDRQMRRYNIPRLSFINKLDRTGADPFSAIQQLKDKLGLNAIAMQIPIGLEHAHCGVVDLVKEKAYYFEGYKGLDVRVVDIPGHLLPDAIAKRNEIIETVGNEDEKLAEWMIENDYPNNQPPVELLQAAIRRQTIARKVVPVFMGAAFKNIGVQPLLDGVIDYLPNPAEVVNMGIDATDPANEKPIQLIADSKKPLVGLAFKLEENKFGQVTFLRIYQGQIKRGDVITNVNFNKQAKIPRLVKMHANELEEITEAGAGEICALFGVECYSGNTFTHGERYLMTSMHVPDPVISLSITPIKKDLMPTFNKALTRFQKEDPTFRVKVDEDSGQTIISGMGELHLQIYSERMRREYGVENLTGKPLVAFRETIGSMANFDYTHKKQSGGAGQFARVAGYIEPLPKDNVPPLEFVDETIGGSIPPHFIEAVRKGFLEGCEKGPMLGQAVQGIRFVVKDGSHHSVDSSDLAFKICAAAALRDAIRKSSPVILEPIMNIEIQAPLEFQGVIIQQLNKRRGVVKDTEKTNEFTTIKGEVPLNQMFGYSTEIRSATQGKAEFSMEYLTHEPVPRDQVPGLLSEYNSQGRGGR
eukprot:Phypoly_transcript_03202.p1 GENE.Phypoly_transcript_03202~~Phypoly_transcript_03202.p1  ORF type:complete len:746 (+),score=144.68 Phypoly_transcript_03202:82-2319(+)